MTESRRPPNDPEQMALEAMWELWANPKSPQTTKIEGLAILKAFKVVPNIHEGETQYDINKVGTWYLGQIYEAVNSERVDELGHLVQNVSRYASKEFYGKRMHDVFEVARARNMFEKKLFETTYSAKDDWLDRNQEPHSQSILKHGLDHTKHEGRRVAVLKPGDFPDLYDSPVEGTLVIQEGDVGSAIYHIKTDQGSVVEVNSNFWVDYKLKDNSQPTFRELTAILKKENYQEAKGGYVTDLQPNEEFKWLKPDIENGNWSLVDAKVVKAPRSSALFDVKVGDRIFNLNTNTFISDGNRIFVSKK